jgi:hypothetical protein
MIKWFLLLTLLSGYTYSEERLCEYYQMGIKAYHWERGRYNEDNVGMGCEGIKGSPMMLTYIKNSYGWDTYLLSYKYVAAEKGKWAIDIVSGANYGYRDRGLDILDSGLSLHVLPRVSYAGEYVGGDLYLLYDQGIALGIKLKF